MAAEVGGDVARDSQATLDGAVGAAGTTGSAGRSGAAGTTGSGGALAGATSETGGTQGAAGTTAPSTGTTPAGGSTAKPDASPDLPSDAPIIVTCPSPKSPSNGRVSAPSLAVGAVATYTCDTGYGSPTVASRTCQGDGTWTGTDALCNLVDCGAPPVIANSTVSAPSTTYNSTAQYTCDTGYSPSTSTVLTCESGGGWSAVPLVCNPVDCGTPPSVANADVIATTTILGSVATTKCKMGFALTGTTNTRTCQADGTWSLPAPACHVADCGAPPPIANGTVSPPRPPSTKSPATRVPLVLFYRASPRAPVRTTKPGTEPRPPARSFPPS